MTGFTLHTSQLLWLPVSTVSRFSLFLINFVMYLTVCAVNPGVPTWWSCVVAAWPWGCCSGGLPCSEAGRSTGATRVAGGSYTNDLSVQQGSQPVRMQNHGLARLVQARLEDCPCLLRLSVRRPWLPLPTPDAAHRPKAPSRETETCTVGRWQTPSGRASWDWKLHQPGCVHGALQRLVSGSIPEP